MPFRRYLKKLKKAEQASHSQPPSLDPESGTDGTFERQEQRNNGLHLLSPSSDDANPTQCPASLIFVHGLGGHHLRTWTHHTGTCWPKDLLPGELPGVRIYSYGYPSAIFANKSVAGVRDFAEHLLDDIRVHIKRPRAIIFVCHSLGGIVVKQAMISAHRNDNHKAILSATKAIIFMGTPHGGSSYADRGKVMADIVNALLHVSFTHSLTGGVRTPLIEGLRAQNPELRAIDTDFVAIAQKPNFKVVNFYELEAHPLTKSTIVDGRSARSGIPGEESLGLYLHHTDLCRFESPHNPDFQKVLDQIKRFTPSDTTETETVESSLRSHYLFDETEKQCVARLNTLDIAEYEEKVGKRVDGTLEWVLRKQQYTDWISSPRTRLLWVTGYAGTGKTVLSSFITQVLRKRRPKALVCRFFCDAQIHSHCDPCAMLRCLIYQLADQKRKFWQMVKKVSDASGFDVFNQFNPLWNLFVRLTSSETKRTIAIIIDSFDELHREAQVRIAERIMSLLSSAGTEGLKFFITSRPLTERVALRQVKPSWVAQLPLGDNQDDIDKDIRRVIYFQLQELVDIGVCPPEMRDSLSEELVRKADRTFLWIKIMFGLLQKRTLLIPMITRSILDLIPRELESLYKQALSEISEDIQHLAASVLRLLVVCDRPLTGDEIGVFVTITPDHKSATLLQGELLVRQDRVQKLLDPLVRVHRGHFELVHVSLKEYLVSLSKTPDDAFAARFAVDPVRDRKWVLDKCWLYLSLDEFQSDVHVSPRPSVDSQKEPEEQSSAGKASSRDSMPSLSGLFEDLTFRETSADEFSCLLVSQKYWAFDFAALYWSSMFRSCEDQVTESDTQMAISLCRPDTPIFKNWFQYYWHKRVPFETIPSSMDSLAVASFLGHREILKYFFRYSTDFGSDTVSNALFWAANQGHDACFVTLLEKLDRDQHNIRLGDQSPLLLALQFGLPDSVGLLLANDSVDINVQDSHGRSALYLAVAGNHLELVILLLQHEGIDVNLPDRMFNTPLHVAVSVAAAEPILEILLADQRTDTGRFDKQGRSILSWAAELGLSKHVAMILKSAPILVEAKDLKGRTPLSYAAQHGRLSIVQMLVEQGHADPEAKDTSGRNVPSWAASQRNAGVLNYLLKRAPKSVNVPDNYGWAPIAWSLDTPGYFENFHLLLHKGHVDANQTDGADGRSLLAWIASFNYTDMAATLINFPGVALDSKDPKGRTALSEAAANGSTKIAQMLLDTGKVDINAKDEGGRTPLIWATKGGHSDTIQLLLGYRNINVSACSNSGERAIDIARKQGHHETITALEKSNEQQNLTG